MNKFFEKLIKVGYTVHNKRVLGNPNHVSSETREKDLTQEYALIVMWLYEKHGIWIQPLPYDTITAAKEWTATILSLNWGEDKEVHYEYKLSGLNSPTEAYEAAIEYILKNLI